MNHKQTPNLANLSKPPAHLEKFRYFGKAVLFDFNLSNADRCSAFAPANSTRRQ